MDAAPITGLDELDKHVDDLIGDPSLPLNPKLFDDVELQLTESNIPPLIPRFLPRLTTLLKQYAQDPAAIVSLTIKLFRPVSFAQILQLASPNELAQALDSPSPAANILAMTILHKAAGGPAEVGLLCTIPSLVAAFIRRWLAAPQVEVGQKGGKVLGDLLDIDCELPPPPPPPSPPRLGGAPRTELFLRKYPGQGKLWHLLFNDTAMYTLLLDLCSGRHPDTAGDPHKLSLAQGRLLRLLPRLAALNFPAVTRSHISAPTPVHLTNGHGHADDCDGEEEEEHAPRRPSRPGGEQEGLLQFAALRMVQKSDLLMHLSLVDFFETLVSLLRVTDAAANVGTLRAVLREATAGDAALRDALVSLPDRTVEEEAEDLRLWLAEVLPGQEGGERLVVR